MKVRLLLGAPRARFRRRGAASFAVLRSAWGGDARCARSPGTPSRARPGSRSPSASCRIDPLRLELVAEGVRLGPAGAPVFAADAAARARSPAIQALGGEDPRRGGGAPAPARPTLALRDGGARRGSSPCPPPALSRVDVRRAHGRGRRARPAARLGRAGRGRARRRPRRAGGRRAGARSAPGATDAVRRPGLGRVLRRRRRDGDRRGGRTPTGELALDLSRLELAVASSGGRRLEGRPRRAPSTDLCRPRLAARRERARRLAGAARARRATARATSRGRSRRAPPLGGAATRADRHRRRPARRRAASAGGSRATRARGSRCAAASCASRRSRSRARRRACAPRATVRLEREPRLEAEAELTRVELAEVLERTRAARSVGAHAREREGADRGHALAARARAASGALDLADFKALDALVGEVPPAEAGGRSSIPRRASRPAPRRAARACASRAPGCGSARETLRADAELFLVGERGFAVRVDGGGDLVGAAARRERADRRPRAARAAPCAPRPTATRASRASSGRASCASSTSTSARPAPTVTYGPGGPRPPRSRRSTGARARRATRGEVAVDLGRSPPEVVDGAPRTRRGGCATCSTR